MKRYKVRGASELKLFSNCDTCEDVVGDDIIRNPIIFEFSVDNPSYIKLVMRDLNNDEKAFPRVETGISLDQIEHLYAWVKVLLKNKVEMTPEDEAYYRR